MGPNARQIHTHVSIAADRQLRRRQARQLLQLWNIDCCVVTDACVAWKLWDGYQPSLNWPRRHAQGPRREYNGVRDYDLEDCRVPTRLVDQLLVSKIDRFEGVHGGTVCRDSWVGRRRSHGNTA
jgi:hypothetical protein